MIFFNKWTHDFFTVRLNTLSLMFNIQYKYDNSFNKKEKYLTLCAEVDG